jgi:hypothetical protein
MQCSIPPVIHQKCFSQKVWHHPAESQARDLCFLLLEYPIVWLIRRNFTTFFRSLLLTIYASCVQVCSFSISQNEKIKIKIAKNCSNQLKQTHKANQPLSCDLLEVGTREDRAVDRKSRKVHNFSHIHIIKYTKLYIQVCSFKSMTSKSWNKYTDVEYMNTDTAQKIDQEMNQRGKRMLSRDQEMYI